MNDRIYGSQIEAAGTTTKKIPTVRVLSKAELGDNEVGSLLY